MRTKAHLTAYYSRGARRRTRIIFLVLYLVQAGIVAAVWLANPFAGAIVLLIVVLVFGWAGYAMLNMGAYANDDHLLVRKGTGGEIAIPWSDIEGFEIGSAQNTPSPRRRISDTVRYSAIGSAQHR
jgi:hypothetical protein